MVLPHDNLTLQARMQGISALVCDVDGVLTDGSLNYTAEGEFKTFSVLDGFGINLAKQAGWRTAFITARGGPAVVRRAEELGVELIQGERNKGTALKKLCARWAISTSSVVYIGDDWIDLPALLQAGLAATVPNAAAAVRARAHWQASCPGGRGAVRELVEAVLSAQGKLEPLLQRYITESEHETDGRSV